MDIQGGFIVGVYNYCDRWCERCPLTSRCRLFADEAELDFERDHGPLTEPFAERQARILMQHAERWKREHGIDFAKIAEEAEADPEPYQPPSIARHHASFESQTKEFTDAVWKWLEPLPAGKDPATQDAIAVLRRFVFTVEPKIRRALTGIADGEQLHDPVSDANGSAKVAR